MSHMIENNMIAWKNQKPWHGLGVQVSVNATGDEMLQLAKLDWKVQRRQLAMRNAQGAELLTLPLENFRAIVRNDTDEVFQIATKRYHPIQNQEIVDFFHNYCEAGHASLEVVGALRGGAVVWALARINGKSTANLQGIDELRGYLLLSTSHDGSLVTNGKATQVRVVCWNTLSAALSDSNTPTFRMKHSAKWTSERKAEAEKLMGMAVQQVSEVNELAERFSRVQLDDIGRIKYVRMLLSGESLVDQMVADSQPQSVLSQIVENGDSEVRQAEETKVGKLILAAMLESPGADLATARNTLWGAVNGVTYYADHVAARNQDNRLSSAWFGVGNDLKQQAVTVARQIAGF